VIFQFPLCGLACGHPQGLGRPPFAYGLAYGFYPDGHVWQVMSLSAKRMLAHIRRDQTALNRLVDLWRLAADRPATQRVPIA